VRLYSISTAKPSSSSSAAKPNLYYKSASHMDKLEGFFDEAAKNFGLFSKIQNKNLKM
jgi:hypothetical protein